MSLIRPNCHRCFMMDVDGGVCDDCLNHIGKMNDAKAVLRKYRNTPLNKIPSDDLENFNYAWVVVQSALTRAEFEKFLKEE